MSESHLQTLGIDQIKWLNKYNTINLKHWRSFIINEKQEWLYVGNWCPGPIEPFPSICDGGYSEREKNLKYNRYFYWTD
jgi:hypothetical protein